MFDNLRKSGSSMIVWVLFGILIAGFVISFGPQSIGSGQGCQSGGRSTMLTVGDKNLDDAAWRFAWALSRGNDAPRSRERATLSTLLRRELLAQEGERRGLRIGDSLVDYVITRGRFFYGGAGQDARGAFFDERGAGVFDFKQFQNFARARFNMTIGQYKRQQSRELLAATTADLLAGSVPVSREEARTKYITENTKVSYEAVTFDPGAYAQALIVTDADLDRYLARFDAEVKASYSDAAWRGKKQVRVSRVHVARTPAPASGTAPAVDPAKTKLEAERAAIAAGRKSFAAVAAAQDADPAFRGTGGDWGWYDEAAMTLPDPALNDAVKALAKAGDVSPVIEAADGFYLLTVVDKREGDLTYDQVKRELAATAARTKWGKEAARRAAEAALAAAKAADKPLSELYPADKLGAVEWTSRTDVPAAWMQPDAPAAPAAPPPAPAEPAAIGPSDVLPAVGPVELQARLLPPHERVGNYTSLGESPALSKALFDELKPGQLGPVVYGFEGGLGGDRPFAIVRLVEKTEADLAAFDKDADKLIAKLAAERGQQYLSDWLQHKCKALVAANQIRARADILINVDENGRRTQVAWDPCAAL